MLEVVVTADGLAELIGKIPNGPARSKTLGMCLDRGRLVVLRNVMRRWSVRTGFGRRSGTTDFDQSLLRAHVTFTAGYSAFPDQGVRPHFISPSAAQVLRFVDPNRAREARATGTARAGSEGAYVYSYGVRHPGQRAQHFMANGLLDSLPEFKTVMESEAATMLGKK